MYDNLLIGYYSFAGLAILFAALACLQTWEHRRFARSRVRRLDDCRPRGKAMIFAPCKGVDLELKRNLKRLFQQDYEEYEITFIAESRADPCCELIERAMAENRHIRSRLVIAGKADSAGQKVHNLRFATRDIPPDVDFLVFVDSDAQPRREWLRAIIGRLGRRERSKMGASTGYRWMVPGRASFANHVLYSINCRVTTLLGLRSGYPVWGGSWAIRRETFEALDFRGRWEGTLSDDLVACRVLREHGRPIKYEPACLVASPVDNSLRETFSFLRRQYMIARCHVPLWWVMGFAIVSVGCLIWPASIAAICSSLISGYPSLWFPAVVLALLYGLSVYRGWMRQDLVRIHFPQVAEKLRAARRFDVWSGPIAPFTHWLAFVSASFGSTITWRGITYRLRRGGRVEIVSRGGELQTVGMEREFAQEQDGFGGGMDTFVSEAEAEECRAA